MQFLRHLTRSAALVLALALAAAAAPSVAEAQCDPMTSPITCNRVGADGKGILGGLILGAEIGFITNALIVNAGVRELDEWWAWILIPAATGALGAVGGYFALEDPTQGDPMMGPTTRGFPEAAVAVFAVSMALIVPTFVGVLALTAYSPGPDTGGTGATGDQDSADDVGADEDSTSAEPVNEAAPEPTSDLRSARQRVLAGGPGLLRFDRGAVLLGLPMVHTADTYTAEEREHMQLPLSADLRVPLVSGTF